MNMAAKNEIFERYKEEYWKATRTRKSEILLHVSDVTKMHRKTVIKRFCVLQTRPPSFLETRGRPTVFTKDVDAALETIWEAANCPCGELLHPIISEYVSVLQRDGLWKHGDEATGKLLAMKVHTVRRRTSSFDKAKKKGRGLSGTKPSNLKSIIPIFSGPWKDISPGYGQIDTVAHCNDSLLGDFIWSLNYTDAATYWVILRPQWNKGAEATQKSLARIKEKLPVRLWGMHPDTGTEFINMILYRWSQQEKIEMTRSEPGKKNHNMYVEERNGHVVRKYLGYIRLDQKELLPIVNELYEKLELYLNHFQTVRRTLSKERVGAKYRRTFEKIPKTPYQRMLDHKDVAEEVKEKLRVDHSKLSPLILKREIDMITAKILRVRNAATITKNG